MAETFVDKGHQAKITSYNKATNLDFTEPEVIGVGSPCFESQAPSVVKDFLWSLPDLSQKKAFVFSTAGGGPGKVLYDLAKPLIQKGADVIGGFLCRGSVFYPIPCLVDRFPQRPNQEDLNKAREFAKEFLAHVTEDKSGPMALSRIDTFSHGFGFYNIVGAIMNDPLLRFLMPKPKITESKCNKCGVCVKQCPTKSIIIKPLPQTVNSCIRCYRCMNVCPEDAITVSWGISNFLVWTIYNQTFEQWLGDIQKNERIY